MECRDIDDREFEAIASELIDATYQTGAVEAIRGWHAVHGKTLLLRDGDRCVAVVDDPTELDRMMTERAFLDGVLEASVRIGRC